MCYRDLHTLSEDRSRMNLSFCIISCKFFVAFCHMSMAAFLFLSCDAVVGTCKLNTQMPLIAGFCLDFAKGINQGKWCGKEKNIEEKWRGEKKGIFFASCSPILALVFHLTLFRGQSSILASPQNQTPLGPISSVWELLNHKPDLDRRHPYSHGPSSRAYYWLAEYFLQVEIPVKCPFSTSPNLKNDGCFLML